MGIGEGIGLLLSPLIPVDLIGRTAERLWGGCHHGATAAPAEAPAALVAAIVAVPITMFVLGAAPEGDGGSGGPLEEFVRSISPALLCRVSTPAT